MNRQVYIRRFGDIHILLVKIREHTLLLSIYTLLLCVIVFMWENNSYKYHETASWGHCTHISIPNYTMNVLTKTYIHELINKLTARYFTTRCSMFEKEKESIFAHDQQGIGCISRKLRTASDYERKSNKTEALVYYEQKKLFVLF